MTTDTLPQQMNGLDISDLAAQAKSALNTSTDKIKTMVNTTVAKTDATTGTDGGTSTPDEPPKDTTSSSSSSSSSSSGTIFTKRTMMIGGGIALVVGATWYILRNK